MNRTHWLAAAGITLATGAGVALGFSSYVTTIESCELTITRYVLAEFSEVELVTGIDVDGAVYTEPETSYWTQPASVVNYTHSLNGELIGHNGPHAEANGYMFPDMPVGRLEGSRSGFDRLRRHTDTVAVSGFAEGSYVSRSTATHYNACLAELERPVVVQTWYGHAYGVEL